MVNKNTDISGHNYKHENTDGSNYMCIFHQNVQGFTLEKKLMLEVFLTKELSAIQVICLTEHWMKCDYINKLNIQGFNLVTSYCRQNMGRGGVSIYIKTGTESRIITNFEYLNVEKHFESCIIELLKYNIVIICVYRTPDSDLDIFLRNLELILDHLQKKKKTIVVIGDLNIDFLKTKIDIELLTLLNVYNMQPLVKVPTRVTQTALDQIIVSGKISSSIVNVLQTGFSDHYAQTVKIDKTSLEKQNITQANTYPTKRIYSKKKTVMPLVTYSAGRPGIISI
jgi:exonuclease III